MWVFSNFPGVSSILPSLVTKLKTAKDKFLMASVAASASSAAKVPIFAKFGNSFEHLKFNCLCFISSNDLLSSFDVLIL